MGLTKGPAGDWCPLAMLSHMLDCQLYGLNPAGHHFTNLLLHAASAVTLFLALWRMTAGLWPSALVAALFAVHPLHVESVAWIAERRDVLSGLFFMLTLAAYTEYVRRPPSPWRYLVVVAMFALGLLAKAMLVTLPPLLLLLDFWPLERFGRTADARAAGSRPTPAWRLVLEKLPLLALALAGAGVAVLCHDVPAANADFTLSERLAAAVISYVAYLGQLFVPIGLSFFYSYPAAGWPAWQVAAAMVLLLAITAAAVVARRSYPYFFVGWFWYVGMLLPVVQIIPFGTHARADRYTYLAQIGLTIALVWGAMQLVATWPARRWILSVGAALVLAILMACAWRQTGYWQNDETLWKHALACDPKSVMAHHQLALAWKEKDPAAAKAQCRLALPLAPGSHDFYYGTRARACALLGEIATREGNTTEAWAWLDRSIAIYPNSSRAHLMLGNLLVERHDFDEALFHFRRCTELEPTNPLAWCNLARTLAKAGQIDDAIVACRQATAVDPNSGISERNLAAYLAKSGRRDEAIAHLRRAIQIDPDNPNGYYLMANLLREQGKRSQAVEFDQRGNQAGVRLAKTRNRRGTELVGEGKLDEAISLFRAAIEADADDAQARCHLADALAQQGQTDQAADQYRQALEIAPDFAPARQGLKKLQGR